MPVQCPGCGHWSDQANRCEACHGSLRGAPAVQPGGELEEVEESAPPPQRRMQPQWKDDHRGPAESRATNTMWNLLVAGVFLTVVAGVTLVASSRTGAQIAGLLMLAVGSTFFLIATTAVGVSLGLRVHEERSRR
ncbi:hypothetical protein GCM10027076_20910 [Nocardioides montaniterrae]